MVKKVLTLALGLVLSFGAMAQWGTGNPTVSQSDIQFWTGTGSNRAVIAITWEDDNEDFIGIAWGVQWNGGSIMLKSLMDTIAAYDSRFTMDYTTWVNNLSYVDTEMGLSLEGIDGWWWYNWLDSNDASRASSGVTYDMVQSGDFVDWMQMGTADTMIMATDPNAPADPQPEDATIAASDILYWVGEGANQVVFAVNWADTALAWGYRFSTDSVSVENVMTAIQSADSRFTFNGGGWLNDINFVEDGDTLGAVMVGWWMSTLNGNSNASVGMSTMLANNDFFKWGDYTVGITVDTVTYAMVFPMTVYPVSAPADPQPEDATIAASDILYWVGEGANQVVFAVNWADTALAWGYRFSTDSVSVEDVMIDIQSADSRFTFSGESWLDDINFVENGDTLGAVMAGWWMSTLNGNSNASAGMITMLANNDFFKWGDYTVGITVDTVTYAMVFPMTVYPVSAPAEPMPEESTIAASEIVYWVGEGSKKVVMAVNWADTALAWGYKFNGNKTVSDMMNDIAAADPRFSIELGQYGIDDIIFVVAPGDTLRKQAYSYWESKNNGVMDAGMGQSLNDGDFEKWAEPAAGIVVDSMEYGGYWYYSYVYTMDIHPVSVPQTQGIAGAEAVSLSVYPNPAADRVMVSGIEGDGTAVLYDMRGSVVATFAVNGNETRLDLSGLTSGVYMLRVADSVVKIVKE